MTTVNVTTTSNTVTVTENGSSTVVQTPVTSTVTATAVGPQGATGATGATGAAGADGIDGADGADGADGSDGAAATIAVGTVSTGAAGSSATVTNSGTSSAAVFDFAIPQGATGATGPAGADGADGADGANGGTDIVLDTTPQLGGDLASNGNNINFADSDKLQFGAGQDLQIFHDGSNSYISETGTGHLNIRANQFFVKSGDGSVTAINYDPNTNHEVSLYHNNIERLKTTASGVEVTGTVFADGVSLGDDERLKLGAGNDLQIFHNSADNTSRIIESGDGNLVIAGQNIIFHNSALTETYARFFVNGSVELNYDHSKKIETTSTGVEVTGTCVATEFSGSGASLTGVAKSDTTGITGASAVNNIVAISQADYDAISSPDANTIYYITS